MLFPKITHTVSEGETLSSIAVRYGVTVNTLYRNNIWLMGLSAISAGETLVIEYESSPTRTITVNGYAYPFINELLLRQTLPYCGYLTPFTYGFTAEGDIVTLNDSELISIASEYSVGSLLHFSTLTESGGFSNELAAAILNDRTLEQTVVTKLLAIMNEKGYAGLDIDFEYVFASDRDNYTSFLSRTTQLMNANGYPVIAALAPKTSSDQPGLLYEGHDYAGIGSAVNAVLLMTYEWGYTYGPPMAVAPIENVKRVLDYAVYQIPSGKILLGFPNYGYDWTLPYIRGQSRAQSVSNVRAVEIAAENNASISFDPFAKAPFFRYFRDGTEHEVWFEDANSARAKLRLINDYDLLGVAYWNLIRPFPQNWLVLNNDFDTSGVFSVN